MGKKDWRKLADDPAYIHRSIKAMTDVIVYDIFSPPVASRIYAYMTIAGYEAARYGDPAHISLACQLHDLKPLPSPEAGKQYDFSLAAVHAILLVGKSMVISEDRVEAFHTAILQEFRDTGMPEQVFDNSIALGKKIADHILAWAAGDNYKQSRSFPKYDPSNDSGSWKPTPPAYMKAVEPHWNKIRPFVIDSAEQFKPVPAIVFSAEKNSPFYKEAWEVYNTGLHLSPEQTEIANFWDCNPFKMNVNGHLMFATKKISPGGHWINITGVACQKAKAGYIKTAEAYACASITMADAFISCWDEKYRSNVIRPETYINQYIDPNWVPLLQTPPFPEYTSGHSVVSASAAVMLTNIFGNDFAFTDSTEMEFGLLPRKFTSFKQAAEEAAISRLYGGIHYMAAIRNGVEEGKAIGGFVSKKLKTTR